MLLPPAPGHLLMRHSCARTSPRWRGSLARGRCCTAWTSTASRSTRSTGGARRIRAPPSSCCVMRATRCSACGWGRASTTARARTMAAASRASPLCLYFEYAVDGLAQVPVASTTRQTAAHIQVVGEERLRRTLRARVPLVRRRVRGSLSPLPAILISLSGTVITACTSTTR